MFITIAGADAKFSQQLKALLEEQNHRVSVMPWAARVLQALKEAPPHLLVLVQPPSRDSALSLLHSVREDSQMRQLPILCVSPKASGPDGVATLDAGADDFIHRPFNPQIFLARVRTLLRRRIWSGDLEEEDTVTSLQCGPLSMKLVSRQVSVSGKPVSLTRLEFDLLAFMLRHVDRVFKREELLEAVWNYPQNIETRTLDKHVETLRRKLGPCGPFIQTVHGVGYRLAVPE